MSFDPGWSSKQLAQALCDLLVQEGLLKEKPAFIRRDREEKIAGIFHSVQLDGAKMGEVDNPGPLEMLVRSATQGEAWVDGVIENLVRMLPQEVRERAKQMEMDPGTRRDLDLAKEERARKMDSLRAGKGGGKGHSYPLDFERDQTCYNCGEPGHISRDCPTKGRGKGRDGGRDDRQGDVECYSCGGRGHFSRECPEATTPARKGKGKGRDRDRQGDMSCYNCGGLGHISRECPEPRKGKGRGRDE